MAAALAALVIASTAACGGAPAQIVDYAPQRGSVDVSTAVPVRITFDHDVDRASVESRLRLSPATFGSVRWLNGHELLYEHSTLRTNTTYNVILEAGYRDLAGNTYTLRHHWSFVTEGPPALAGSTPAVGDRGVDPAAYLLLDFTRAMSAVSLKSAVTLSPDVPFDVRVDPTDSLRVIVAPSQLLAPNTPYQLSVSTAALDVDGNQLDRFQSVAFTTGPPKPLHGWITFTTTTAGGLPGGLWIVDESGFPRAIFNSTGVSAFSWSPAGDSALLQAADGSWWNFSPGTGSVQLDFKATWAAALAPGMGYVFIDQAAALHRESADGTDTVIAHDVSEASVAPNGSRLLFILGATNRQDVWGYDAGLRATYLLASDTAPVFAAAWAPAGNRIAYLRHDPSTVSLRVRSLGASGVTTTVATGDLGPPQWLSDSSHLVVAAAISSSNRLLHKAFVLNAASPVSTLAPASGLPADPNVDVGSPMPSPDGHQIAFLNDGQVWLMNADGTRAIPLTKQDPGSFPYSCRAVAWTRT